MGKCRRTREDKSKIKSQKQMKNINLAGKIFISIVAMVVLGFVIPTVGAQGPAQFNNAAGDMPTLQGADHTVYAGSNTNWSTNVSVNPSDVVSFMVFYHNTSFETALDTRVQINLPSSISNGMNVTATISASNAASVQGNATVYINNANGYNGYNGTYPLSYLSGSATWYDQGSSNATPWLFGQNGDQVVSSGGVMLGNIPAGDVGYVVIRAQMGGSNYYNNGNNNGNGIGASASTGTAVNITNTSATLAGTVYPNGYDTTAWFQYGTTSGLGYNTQAQDVGSISSVPNFTSNVVNLVPGTTYYYRLVAQNVYGTNYGAVLTFNTPSYYTGYNPNYTPTYYNNSTNYVTSAASSGVVGSTSATLSGTAFPNGANTNAWFEYGTTASFGYTTPSQNVGSGYSNVNISANLTNLLPNTTYYYRVDAQNNYGTSDGSTLTFTTSGSSVNTTGTYNSGTNSTLSSILNSMNRILLSIRSNYGSTANQTSQNYQTTATVVAASAPTTSATITGTAFPNNAATTAWFEYGPTTSFGYKTAAQDVGSGSVTVPISATINGLNPNTTYYYRAVAQNAYGSSDGATLTFTTGGGVTNTATQTSSTYSTASILSALGGNWTIIGLIILILIGIGVVVFLRFVLK